MVTIGYHLLDTRTRKICWVPSSRTAEPHWTSCHGMIAEAIAPGTWRQAIMLRHRRLRLTFDVWTFGWIRLTYGHNGHNDKQKQTHNICIYLSYKYIYIYRYKHMFIYKNKYMHTVSQYTTHMSDLHICKHHICVYWYINILGNTYIYSIS